MYDGVKYKAGILLIPLLAQILVFAQTDPDGSSRANLLKRKTVFMRRATIAILWLLAVISLTSYERAQELAPPIRAGEHRLPFQARDDLIYIRAVVNGSHTTLLVDTGAVFTIFTEKAVPTLNADLTVTINTAKGSVLASRFPVRLALGDSDPPEQHCAFRMNAIVGKFKFLNAEGVIGLDILKLFKSVTFDFKNSVIILEDR